MKTCPLCNKVYKDPTLNYCLDDGIELSGGKTGADPTLEFRRLPSTLQFGEVETQTVFRARPTNYPPASSYGSSAGLLWVALLVGALVIGFGLLVGYMAISSKYFSRSGTTDQPSVDAGGGGSRSTDPGDTNHAADDPADVSSAPPNKSGDTENRTGRPGITLENYFRMQRGLTYEEVSEILGGPGKKTSEKILPFGNIPLTTYEWTRPNAGIILTFEGGKLVSRAQGGLDRKLTPDLSREKFDQIKKGASYEDVVAILGGEGIETVNTLTGLKVFQWNGEKKLVITVSFRVGKVIDKTSDGKAPKTK